MSLAAYKAAWAADVTGSGKLVLLALADFADEDGVAWPAQATLATMVGLSTRAVRRAVAELIAAGVLTEIAEGRGARNTKRVGFVGIEDARGQGAAQPSDPRTLGPSDPTPNRNRTSALDAVNRTEATGMKTGKRNGVSGLNGVKRNSVSGLPCCNSAKPDRAGQKTGRQRPMNRKEPRKEQQQRPARAGDVNAPPDPRAAAARSDVGSGHSAPHPLGPSAPFDQASPLDALFDAAARLVGEHGRATVSLLQRGLGVDYRRALVLLGQVHAAGIAAEYDADAVRSARRLAEGEQRVAENAAHHECCDAAAKLRGLGVHKAHEAVEQYGAQRCLEVAGWAHAMKAAGRIQSPAGWALAALRDGYSEPPEVRAAAESRAADLHDQVVRQNERRRKAADERRDQQNAAERARTVQRFLKLPPAVGDRVLDRARLMWPHKPDSWPEDWQENWAWVSMVSLAMNKMDAENAEVQS